MDSKKIVEVISLSHQYTVAWAIKDINFHINETGVVGLLGSNGAGKSTTMNIISGVLRQTEGDVFINGVNFRNNLIEAKKHIGFLPQNAPLHLDLTIDEYLYHCAQLRRIPDKDIDNAREIAKEKCGLTHLSKRLIKSLSGGYKQRVGIAQSIIHNPSLVIMDEPTNGLDPNQIVAVRKLIREIAKERAVLISTHILSEVQEVCDNIIMIDRGVLVFNGTKFEFNNCVAPSTLIFIVKNKIEEKSLLSINGLSKVEQLTDLKLRIHFDKNINMINKLVEFSIENNLQIEELYLENKSLDTIFAKLSGKE